MTSARTRLGELWRHWGTRLKAGVRGPKRLRLGPFNFYLLSERPLVVMTFTMGFLEHVERMAEGFDGKPGTFLVGSWWDMSDPGRAHAIAGEIKRVSLRFPNVRLLYLCNSPAEMMGLAAFSDVETHLVSSNAWVDDRLFRPLDGSPDLDAIYTGRLAPFKRLELAGLVRSLGVLTAPVEGRTDTPYARRVRAELSHAEWFNFDAVGRYRRIDLPHVPHVINRARVGLILSAAEGACYASIEYLLCGLAVVSTPSRGGRDLFFTPETSVVVSPDPASVRDGVAEVVDRRAPPETVRGVTLELVHDHRARFHGIMDEVLGRSRADAWRAEVWPWLFSNKMRVLREPSDFSRMLTLEGFRSAALDAS